MIIKFPSDVATCPECGDTFTIDPNAVTVEEYHPGYHNADEPLPTRERTCIVAFCNGCEFCVEIGRVLA